MASQETGWRREGLRGRGGRPWTMPPTLTRRRRRLVPKINTPIINTYSKQIQQCADMYKKIQFDRTPRSHTALLLTSTRSRELTSLSNVSGGRMLGVESAPPWVANESGLPSSPRRRPDVAPGNRKEALRSDSDAAFDLKPDQSRPRMNPVELSEHLRTHGFGEPQLCVSSHLKRFADNQVPQGLRCRVLPKNPSLREKIKGRARLDYEIANMKALAFCEEHRVNFRTASAHLRSRDVRFVEEEMKERALKEQRALGHEGSEVEESDEEGSIVASPLTRAELFDRIHTWMDGVDKAWQRN